MFIIINYIITYHPKNHDSVISPVHPISVFLLRRMATLTSFRFILLYPRQWISSGRGLRWVHYILTATSSSEWFCDFTSYICGLLSLVCYLLAISNSTPSKETKIEARKWTYQGRPVVSMPGALHCTFVPSDSTYVLAL